MKTLKQTHESINGKKRLQVHGRNSTLISQSKKRTAFNLKMLGIKS